MTSPHWNDRAVQQLVRCESLFALLSELQSQEDISKMAQAVARQFKYIASVVSYRLIVKLDVGFAILQGHRGSGHAERVLTLLPWEAQQWQHCTPWCAPLATRTPDAPAPEIFQDPKLTEVNVLPVVQNGTCTGLLVAGARHHPFSALDHRFMRLLALYLEERVAALLMRQRAMEALLSKASTDALTGLLNHGTILERLNSQLALSRRTGLPLSVVLCDIDYFKLINDTYGHMTGDVILRDIADRLALQTREGDSIGRYGGEEFLLVLYPCSEEEVRHAAERIRAAIADDPFRIDCAVQTELDVTISIGTCSTSGRFHVDANTMLQWADSALYQSKEAGRNRVTVGTFMSSDLIAF